VPYVIGQGYEIEVVADGTTLEVRVDGALVFAVSDDALDFGSIGLYCWGNEGSHFDDILVENLSGGNQAPIIQSVTTAPSLILDNETSQLQAEAYDPDSGPGQLEYSWSVETGQGNLSDTTIANPVYTPPDVSSTQTFTIKVDVSDGLDTATSTVEVTVSDASAGNGQILLSENFNDGDYAGWNIVDEGDHEAPSNWSAASGTMIQSSNIYLLPLALAKATYAWYTDGSSWADYRTTLTISSDDNDILGLMFRYQD
jgi:hypothetical protein